MRLLITTDAVGGIWRYTLDLAAGLPEPPVIAVMGPAPTPAQRLEALAIPGIDLVQTNLPLDWTADHPDDLAHATATLTQLATGFDGVHLHAPALVGITTWPAPVIAVAHSCVGTWWRAVRTGPLPPDLAWRAALTHQGLNRATIITPTQAHADDLDRTYRFAHSKVVWNGASPSPISAGEGWDAGREGTLTAGRLWDEGKSTAWLDRAAAKTNIRAAGPTRGPNGSTQYFQHLTLLGTLTHPQLAQEYKRAQIFASMAAYEPFGLAALEAAQAGCALVLRDIPSARELWEGVAIFVRTEPELLPALHQAQADMTLGPKAQARARRYTVAAMVQGTLAVHASLRVGA